MGILIQYATKSKKDLDLQKKEKIHKSLFT